MTLPVKEDVNDSVFRRYNAFKKTTSAELFGQIRDLAKQHNPDLIICTYTDAGVDLIRMESSAWLASEEELPWNYFSTDHVKSVLGSYSDKFPSNLLQYFLAIPYRHIATSPSLSRVWVLENMLNGAPLDVYVIGTLVNQKDRRFLPVMRDIYRFHKANEKLFTNLQPVSKVALIRGSQEEYRGMIKLLSEEHIMYDIIEPSAVLRKQLPKKLQEYDALILGEITEMSDPFISIIDDYVKNGGKILCTGFTSTKDEIGTPANKIRLEALGVEPNYETFVRTKSTYLAVSNNDKAVLGSKQFEDFDLMMMYSDFLKCKVKNTAKGYLSLLPGTMFGPPEKSYYTESQLTDFPGVITNNYGKGKSVFIPWQIGRQYNFKGHYAHKTLFVSTLRNLLKVESSMETNASPLIEMTRLSNRNGAFEWIGMLNHSGQISASLQEPVTVHNTTLRFKPLKPVRELKLLRSNSSLNFKQTNGWVECTIPKVADFEMLLCLYK